MSKTTLLSVAILALVFLPAAAQNFGGTFTAANDQGQQTILKLVQSGEKVTGTMRAPANTFQIDGVLEEGTVVGTMTLGQQGGFWFEADLEADDLYITLVAPGANGEPDYESATTFLLNRLGSGSDGQVGGAEAAGNETAVQPEPAPETQPEQPQRAAPAGIHDGSPQAVEWANFLANKKATKMSSYSSGGSGGYSSRTDYHLCANGTFHMADASSVNVDVGGAYGYNMGSGSNAGTWRVLSQGQLVGIELHYQNGEVSQHRLDHDQQSGATYVDGERWLITPTDQCGY
ncbi:MAG: hypothetical protein WBW88_19140 [Rhodothermales bacterium]